MQRNRNAGEPSRHANYLFAIAQAKTSKKPNRLTPHAKQLAKPQRQTSRKANMSGGGWVRRNDAPRCPKFCIYSLI